MFSILISCYQNDNANFLYDSLESIINQTISPSEVVLVKDGPLNEGLENVIENFKKKFINKGINLIVVSLQANQGLGFALQQGLSHCNEEYVVRMDADDISREYRLESLAKLIEINSDIDIFGSQIEEFIKTPNDLGRFRNVPLKHSKILKYSVWRNPMNHVTVCFKKDVVLNAGGYESMLWLEDWFLWIKLLNKKNIKFLNTNEVHVDVRISSMSERRTGYRYLQAELNFCREAVRRRYWTIFSSIKYLFPRILLRPLPVKALEIIYSRMLRIKKSIK
jgi:glycosyltransferase involved in cell wall biosynthesis